MTSASNSGYSVVESGLPLVYLNQFGGQDELVFDGASFVLMQTGLWRRNCPPGRKKSLSRIGAKGRTAGSAHLQKPSRSKPRILHFIRL